MNTTLTYLIDDDTDFTRARLPSLYSDFETLKTINPDGYNANLATWQNALARALNAGVILGNEDRLILHNGAYLRETLRTKEYGTPSAINFLIDSEIAAGRMVPLETFLKASPSLYDKHWLALPWQMMHWGFQHLGFVSRPVGRSNTGSYVVTANLEALANKIMHLLARKDSRTERIMPRSLFVKEICSKLGFSNGVSSNDLSCLLIFLSRDKGFLAFDEEVVKLSRANDACNEITANDRDMASIQNLMANLTTQVQDLTQAVERHTEAARTSVASSNKSAALRHLRSKKLQEEVLAKRTSILLQVEAAWSKIEEASSHVEFIKTMEQTTSTLRALHAEIGGLENVDAVIGAFNTEISKAEDTSSAILSGAGGYVVEESDIDLELAALETGSDHEAGELAIDSTHKALEDIEPVPQTIPSSNPQEAELQSEELESSSRALDRLSLAG